MFVSNPRKVMPPLPPKRRIPPWGWINVATIIVGIVALMESAAIHGPGNLAAPTARGVGFIQSDISSTKGFADGEFFGYDIESGFKAGMEDLGFRKDTNPAGGLAPAETLSGNRLNLAGIYAFDDGAWRLKPYVGVGFATVDLSDRLLGNRPYDQATAYQLRGGVTVGVTQRLFGGVEYRWTNGSRPYLSLTGIPAKLEVNNHGFLAGVNYHF